MKTIVRLLLILCGFLTSAPADLIVPAKASFAVSNAGDFPGYQFVFAFTEKPEAKDLKEINGRSFQMGKAVWLFVQEKDGLLHPWASLPAAHFGDEITFTIKQVRREGSKVRVEFTKSVKSSKRGSNGPAPEFGRPDASNGATTWFLFAVCCATGLVVRSRRR